jgi:hypothetical protein
MTPIFGAKTARPESLKTLGLPALEPRWKPHRARRIYPTATHVIPKEAFGSAQDKLRD